MRLNFPVKDKLELKRGSQRPVSSLAVGGGGQRGLALWDPNPGPEQPPAGGRGSLKPHLPIWISSGRQTYGEV